MSETTEEAVLLALETREDLFESLYEMLSSDNYVRVLMEVEEGKAKGKSQTKQKYHVEQLTNSWTNSLMLAGYGKRSLSLGGLYGSDLTANKT